MRTLTLLAVATVMAVAASATVAFAGDDAIRNLRASRVQVASSCAAYDGIGLLAANTAGQYGCYTRGGWIHCENDGNCLGARYDRYRDDSAAFAGKPGVEGMLSSSHVTQLFPRRNDK